jgi:hypothetical protein
MSLQPITSWNLYGLAPNRGYTQVNKNEGIREEMTLSGRRQTYAKRHVSQMLG